MRVRSIVATLLVALGLAVLGTAGVGAQSSPPASPQGSVAPSPSVAASPSLAPGGSPAASASDPRCDPFVTSDIVAAATGQPVTSLDFFDNGGVVAPLIDITCTWRAQAPLKDVYLQVSDLLFSKGEPPFLIKKYEQGTPIADLGQTAYSLVENGSNLVAWEIRFGKTERTLLLYGYSNPTEALIALARQITADAQPGAAPAPTTPVAPGGSGVPTGDLSALYGAWLLTGSIEHPLSPGAPPVTLTLVEDGSARIDVACKPAKKSTAPSMVTTYTATATTIDTAPGSYKGACKAGADSDFVNQLSFLLGVTFGPGAWTVSGDTLTVTGGFGPVTFQRATPP